MLYLNAVIIAIVNKIFTNKTNKMKRLIILMLLVVSTTAIFAQTANQEKQKKEHKTKTTYRCPMHPEVTSNKPGKCPKSDCDNRSYPKQ